MINLFEKKYFKNNESTLKKTSADDANKESINYMVDSSKKVIDFDGVKNDYVKDMKLKNTPKSNDTLCECDGELYFIEFKNGNMEKAIYDVNRKIFESLLIFTDIIKENISFTRKNVNYILVYNKEKSSKYIKKSLKNLGKNEIQESQSYNKILGKMSKLSNRELDVFGLSKKFEKLYFKKVHTYNKQEFIEKFVKQFEAES